MHDSDFPLHVNSLDAYFTKPKYVHKQYLYTQTVLLHTNSTYTHKQYFYAQTVLVHTNSTYTHTTTGKNSCTVHRHRDATCTISIYAIPARNNTAKSCTHARKRN